MLARELSFDDHPAPGTCQARPEIAGVSKREGTILQECGVGLVEVRRDGEPRHSITSRHVRGCCANGATRKVLAFGRSFTLPKSVNPTLTAMQLRTGRTERVHNFDRTRWRLFLSAVRFKIRKLSRYKELIRTFRFKTRFFYVLSSARLRPCNGYHLISQR